MGIKVFWKSVQSIKNLSAWINFQNANKELHPKSERQCECEVRELEKNTDDQLVPKAVLKVLLFTCSFYSS